MHLTAFITLPLAQTMTHFFASILSALAFGIVGIFLMLLGYKAFDWITPKLDVEKELSENHNIAVAIVIAAVVIGVSILIAHIVAA